MVPLAKLSLLHYYRTLSRRNKISPDLLRDFFGLDYFFGIEYFFGADYIFGAESKVSEYFQYGQKYSRVTSPDFLESIQL